MSRVFRSVAVAGMLIASTVAAQPSAMSRTMPPEQDQQLAHSIYKEIIEIQSGYTTGATTPVAEAVARQLRAAGFDERDIFIGGAAPNKMNLVVRYHRTGRRRPILLLAHTDVVEAKREDWSMDPFVLNEKDGYFYGRGTGDDKAQAAIWIANLIRYKREGFKPDRDLIVALTADEEGGGPFNGVQWLIKNRRDLIDADYALNEGGWGESVNGTRLSNDVQVSEKYVINYRFEVRNIRWSQLAASRRQRDLPPGRRAGAAVAIRFPAEDQRRHARILPRDVRHRAWPGERRSRGSSQR